MSEERLGIPFAPRSNALSIGWNRDEDKQKEEKARSSSEAVVSEEKQRSTNSNEKNNKNKARKRPRPLSSTSTSAFPNKIEEGTRDSMSKTNDDNNKKIAAIESKQNAGTASGDSITRTSKETPSFSYDMERKKHVSEADDCYYGPASQLWTDTNDSKKASGKRKGKQEHTDDSTTVTNGVHVEWISKGDEKAYAVVSFREATPAASICIAGTARLELLKGSMEILGYEMSSKESTTTSIIINNDDSVANSASCAKTTNVVHVESPTWMSLLTFIPLAAPTVIEITASYSTLPPAVGSRRQAFRLYPTTHPDIRPIVLPNKWKAASLDILSCLAQHDRTYFSNPSNNMDPYGTPLVAGDRDSDSNGLERHNTKEKYDRSSGFEDYQRAPNFYLNRTVVCGSKGVGKSTCVRYLVNQLLSCRAPTTTTTTTITTTTVALLDIDVGQPEVSPPGMMSLVLIKSPILYPPHCHYNRRYVHQDNDDDGGKTVIISAYYYGDVTSKTDPTLYLETVQQLLYDYEEYMETNRHEYADDNNDVPLIVNTDGWVKGMGLEILSTLLLDLIRPAHVVQLVGDTKAKQFDLPCNNKNEGHNRDSSSYNNKSNKMQQQQKYYILEAYQRPTAMDKSFPLIPPMALRNLRLCHYFTQDNPTLVGEGSAIDFGVNGIVDVECLIANYLAAAHPYCISSKDDGIILGIRWADFANQDLILDALNGTIVGMCYINKQQQQGSSLGLDNTRPLRCLGLGIVRGIDPVKGRIFVLTPVKDLEQVNLLMGGRVALPLECVFRGVYAESFPYQACDATATSLGIGTDQMKSRNNILRKGISGASL